VGAVQLDGIESGSIARRQVCLKSSTICGSSSISSARGVEVSMKPSFATNTRAAARTADGAGGGLPPWNEVCDTRPVCHSCTAILPPRAWTASVTSLQP